MKRANLESYNDRQSDPAAGFGSGGEESAGLRIVFIGV